MYVILIYYYLYTFFRINQINKLIIILIDIYIIRYKIIDIYIYILLDIKNRYIYIYIY